jgi:hypothetical protein
MLVTALPDDLSPDRDPRGEHPCRTVHGYHLLGLSHGVRKASSERRDPPHDFSARSCVVSARPVYGCAAGGLATATLKI